MGILDFFFTRREATAGIAKERLQIVLAHERAGREAPEFLPALQRDLLAVVAKYVAVKEEFIRVNLGRQSAASVLEINIEFDAAQATAKPVGKPAAAPAKAKAGDGAAAKAADAAQTKTSETTARGKSAGKRG